MLSPTSTSPLDQRNERPTPHVDLDVPSLGSPLPADAHQLAGVELPKFPDEETSFAELTARIAKTVDFIETLKPAQIDGSESREITIPIGGQPYKFSGQNYLIGFALPNFYFHHTTAYAILRQCGVEIGKRDYLGAFTG